MRKMPRRISDPFLVDSEAYSRRREQNGRGSYFPEVKTTLIICAFIKSRIAFQPHWTCVSADRLSRTAPISCTRSTRVRVSLIRMHDHLICTTELRTFSE